jgi:hypothetical protein
MRSRRFAALAVGLSLTLSTPALAAGDYVLHMTPQDKVDLLNSRKDPANTARTASTAAAGNADRLAKVSLPTLAPSRTERRSSTDEYSRTCPSLSR